MKVFLFAKILEIAQLPVKLKNALIDEAYSENTANGMLFEAAVRLMDVPAAKRGIVYGVTVSTFEVLNVEVQGKFIFVHEF